MLIFLLRFLMPLFFLICFADNGWCLELDKIESQREAGQKRQQERISELRREIDELSFDELLSLDVGSALVRDVDLDGIPFVDNPFDYRLENIPATVEILERDTIEARGLKNVVEVVRDLSGIISGESPSEPYTFSLRGFTRDSVAVLYDGISLGRSTINMRPLGSFNLERVEVAKGPTVMGHGAGAPGGTVNIVPRKARVGDLSASRLFMAYGRFDTFEQAFESRGSIHESVAVQASVSHRESNGWVERTDSESLDLNTSLSWRPSDEIQLDLQLHTLHDELPGYWGSPLLPAGAASDPNYDVVATEGDLVIDEDNRYTNYNVADNVIESDSHFEKATISWLPARDTRVTSSIFNYDADRDWRNAETYSFNSDSEGIDRDRLLVSHDRQFWGGSN